MMIEAVTSNNIDEVLPLIKQYQAFYQAVPISDGKNQSFFSQFGPESSLGCQFLCRKDDVVVGFATVYFSFASTIADKVAILNDLYAVPEFRQLGVGRRLLLQCQQYAKAAGAARLQWVTAPDNAAAQKLYDDIATSKSSWLFYTLNT